MATGPARLGLQPQLEELRAQFAANTQRAAAIAGGMAAAKLAQRPRDGGWSIAECIAHLTIMTREWLRLYAETFATAPAGTGPYRKDLVGRLLAWSMEPPYRLKSQTLPSFEPQAADPAHVHEEFAASQELLFALLEKANGLALDKVKLRSVFNERIHYNLFSMFHILAAHQRRHLWQAEQVMKQL